MRPALNVTCCTSLRVGWRLLAWLCGASPDWIVIVIVIVLVIVNFLIKVRGIVDVQVCCRGLCSGKRRRHVQNEDDICWDSRNLGF